MVRYKPSQFTKKELEVIVIALATDSGIDFLTGGKLNKYKRKAALAIWRFIKPAAKATSQGTLRASLGIATRAAPVALPAYAGYLGADLARRQFEEGGIEQALGNVPLPGVIQPAIAERLGLLGTPLAPTIDLYTPAVRRKKQVTTYAKNVGKAMKAVKASVKGGVKGTLSNPKKTFSTVSKTVSKIMKGGTRPRSGIGNVISKAVKGSYKKRTKRSKKKRKRYNPLSGGLLSGY